jgi:hypothetical protein
MPASYIVNTASQALAQNGSNHRQITVTNVAADLLDGITLEPETTHVLVQFNTATARVTFDGDTDPTTTLGFRFISGTTAYWSKDLARTVKVIRETGTDVTVELQELNFR